MKETKILSLMKIASAVIILTLLMVYAVSGTLAKYVSSVSGESKAIVAKWQVEVNGTDIARNDIVDFNLFNTIKEADTVTEETHVSKGEIAPGTGGSFVLDIENKSEVDAIYSITLNEENTLNIPIQYSLDGNTWSDDLTSINESNKEHSIEKGIGKNEITIYWRWAFEGVSDGAHAGQTDENDTVLGTSGEAPTVKITAEFHAEQAD